MIDGIVYGEDPKQGFAENGKFYHPELKFEFPYPRDWQLVNTPARVQIAPKDGKAVIIFSLAQGQSLSAAQQAAIQEDSLKVIDSRDVTVNGFKAIETTADLNAQVRLLMYLIEYDGKIYKFSGLSETPNFNTYKSYFLDTFKNFKQLTDQTKLNKKPERVRIKTVAKDGTVQDAFKSFKVASGRMEEMAILNSMQLKDPIKKGTLIKVVEE